MMIASMSLTAASAFVAHSAHLEMRLATAASSRPACGPARAPAAAATGLGYFEPALGLEARPLRHLVAPGIVRMDATDFVIERAIVDRIFEQQLGSSRQVQVRPQAENGSVIGIRVFGLRESILGALGMENGDILQSINGLAITSPENALEAYARLRNADHFEVHVRRGGADVVLCYDIE